VLKRQATYAELSVSADGNHQHPLWSTVLHGKVQRASESLGSHYHIPEVVFQELLCRLCPHANQTLLPEQFLEHQPVLLHKATFGFLIQLYFDNFHTLYPFLDQSFLSLPVWGWSLCLAAASIGTRYLGIPELTEYGDALCGILHQLLLTEVSIFSVCFRPLALIGYSLISVASRTHFRTFKPGHLLR
jgi:hypothetical protein